VRRAIELLEYKGSPVGAWRSLVTRQANGIGTLGQRSGAPALQSGPARGRVTVAHVNLWFTADHSGRIVLKFDNPERDALFWGIHYLAAH
jgi:hypothetical protein